MSVSPAIASAPSPVSYQGLSVKKVAEKFGKSVPWVWLQARSNPAFPKPVKVGPNTTVWLAHELDQYIERCIEQSRGTAVAA
ncbi:helix-turn-helix transcriptional regulator [Paraburkholderia sp. CI3]|uniref:helix-turn-helix transcriptional regulator n=1 Tax=Paraburkholderia sp. CI3 TaxID=2991060 RepID=UPI003D1C3444